MLNNEYLFELRKCEEYENKNKINNRISYRENVENKIFI
jgi:hypothetical protein